MEILRTTPVEILSVAERWKNQYENQGKWGAVLGGVSSLTIYQRLSKLTRESTPADVARIIGNDGWTGYRCDECGEHVETAVQLGAPPDYGSNTATLCVSCVRKLCDVVNSITED